MSLSPSPSTISSQEMLQDTGRLLADVAEDSAIEYPQRVHQGGLLSPGQDPRQAGGRGLPPRRGTSTCRSLSPRWCGTITEA